MQVTNVTRRGNPTDTTKRFRTIIASEAKAMMKAFEGLKNKGEQMLDNKYQFVSREEEVDYLRVLRETPKGTPFVLVEEKTRSHKPRKWTLFVHTSVLHHDRVQGKKLCGMKVSPNWGITSIPKSQDFPYRYVSASGKFPGIIKQEIEKLRRNKSPKDTLTNVTYI